MHNALPAILLTFALALPSGYTHAASQVEANTALPRATTDPSVAKAVAEAAAAASVPVPDRGPADSTPRAFDALGASQRRCSPLESAAKVALVAACVRLSCSPPPAAASPPGCYLFKANVRG